MHALVLAAGVGSRLRPYTNDRPKPMLEIGGQPILAYNIAMLAAAGFDDVAVNLHYLPDVVRAYVGDGRRWGVRVRYSEERELRGTAGALVPVAETFAQGTFAVVFGDNIAQLDLAEMLGQHRERGAAATIAVWERDDVSQSGVAEVDPSGQIERFVEKPRQGETTSHWVNAGTVIAEPEILTAIPRDRPSDFGRDIFPTLLARGDALFAYRETAGLWWFDRVEDYEHALSDPRLAAFSTRSRGART